ncbi:unnamed protein product [Lampetra fluviatilis]
MSLECARRGVSGARQSARRGQRAGSPRRLAPRALATGVAPQPLGPRHCRREKGPPQEGALEEPLSDGTCGYWFSAWRQATLLPHQRRLCLAASPPILRLPDGTEARRDSTAAPRDRTGEPSAMATAGRAVAFHGVSSMKLYPRICVDRRCCCCCCDLSFAGSPVQTRRP